MENQNLLFNKISYQLNDNADMHEFEDFMKKVDEIARMVRGLSPPGELDVPEDANNEPEDQPRVSSFVRQQHNHHEPVKSESKAIVNRTIINTKTPSQSLSEDQKIDTESGQATMSQEAFMRVTEADINKRKKERMKRLKESGEIKTEANKAFRSKEYIKALMLYNKAITIRRDSVMLYNNRALTNICLGLYSRALDDCEWALKCYEGSLKARLYRARAYHGMGELEKAKEAMDEAKERFPKDINYIDEYEKTWPKDEEINTQGC